CVTLEFRLQLRTTHVHFRLQAFGISTVETYGGNPHWSNLDGRNGNMNLLTGGRGGWPVVDDDRVRHARLVARESLELWCAPVNVGPTREVGNRALAALTGRKAHRAMSRSVFLRHRPLLR